MSKQFKGLIVLMSLWAGGADAALIAYRATLSGAAENPPNASAGSGIVMLAYDTDALTLQIDVAFSDLGSPTTNAHIHCCVLPTANAGVATTLPTFPGFPQNVTSGTFSSLLDLNVASSFNPSFQSNVGGGSVSGARDALITGLNAGLAYFNIHTVQFGGGEVRGNLATVPEPAAIALFGIGLGFLALRLRLAGGLPRGAGRG